MVSKKKWSNDDYIGVPFQINDLPLIPRWVQRASKIQTMNLWIISKRRISEVTWKFITIDIDIRLKVFIHIIRQNMQFYNITISQKLPPLRLQSQCHHSLWLQNIQSLFINGCNKHINGRPLLLVSILWMNNFYLW